MSSASQPIKRRLSRRRVARPGGSSPSSTAPPPFPSSPASPPSGPTATPVSSPSHPDVPSSPPSAASAASSSGGGGGGGGGGFFARRLSVRALRSSRKLASARASGALSPLSSSSDSRRHRAAAKPAPGPPAPARLPAISREHGVVGASAAPDPAPGAAAAAVAPAAAAADVAATPATSPSDVPLKSPSPAPSSCTISSPARSPPTVPSSGPVVSQKVAVSSPTATPATTVEAPSPIGTSSPTSVSASSPTPPSHALPPAATRAVVVDKPPRAPVPSAASVSAASLQTHQKAQLLATEDFSSRVSSDNNTAPSSERLDNVDRDDEGSEKDSLDVAADAHVGELEESETGEADAVCQKNAMGAPMEVAAPPAGVTVETEVVEEVATLEELDLESALKQPELEPMPRPSATQGRRGVNNGRTGANLPHADSLNLDEFDDDDLVDERHEDERLVFSGKHFDTGNRHGGVFVPPPRAPARSATDLAFRRTPGSPTTLDSAQADSPPPVSSPQTKSGWPAKRPNAPTAKSQPLPPPRAPAPSTSLISPSPSPDVRDRTRDQAPLIPPSAPTPAVPVTPRGTAVGAAAAAAAAAVATGMGAPNPLALLAKLEVAASGYVFVTMHGGPLKMRLFRRNVVRRYAEVRGRVVLLRDIPRGPVLSIFSPVGAAVSVADTTVGKRGAVEHSVTVAKGGHSLQLRFASETVAEHWAATLAKVGAVRVPRLSDFEILAPIGEGASGKVFLVRDRKTGRKLALKCMAKSASALATSSPDSRHAIDERVTHEVMNNSHYIVSLRHAFQTRSKLYLATEFCDGGDVYNFVDSRGGGVSEDQARLITAQVVLGIKKLHDANIVFRDLKPENALITGDGRIRLADFGLCKQLEAPAELTSTVCGTFSYAAAEILSGGGYGRACDLWAVGIFLYHIMIGRPPRVSASVQEAKANIFDSKEPIIWYSDVMSEQAMSLVTALIEVDPSHRLGCGPAGISEVFDHPFFDGIDWAALAAGDVPSDIKDALPASELGDLRNFNQEEWANIVMDPDVDEAAYTESNLWPIRNLASHPLPPDYVVSYAYSAESSLSVGMHVLG